MHPATPNNTKPRRIIDFAKNADKLYTQVFHQLQNAKTRFVVVYGGAGSSKSFSVHQYALINIMKWASGDTLVIRKYASDIRQSCYKLFKTLIANYGLNNCFNSAYSADNRRITCTGNGRSLVFKGVDDPEKLKSIVGFNNIILEEASQLEFEDFLELNRRARGMEDIQITLILNPVSENHWIKTKLIDGPYANQTTALRFTYHHNCNHTGHSFLTAADIAELERLKQINENQYRIYVLAEWGVDSSDSKFCWAFNREHIKETELEPGRGVWASFDFNVNPLTCTVAQVYPRNANHRAIECIKLENSDIWKMCHRLSANLPQAVVVRNRRCHRQEPHAPWPATM